MLTNGTYLAVLVLLVVPFNWRAAVMFALALGVGQVTARYQLSQTHLLAGYTLLAVVASFYFDRYSGLVLALVGLVIGAHILGYTGHRTKVLAGEALIIAGMLFCAFHGPSGGIRANSGTASDDKRLLGRICQPISNRVYHRFHS